MIVEHFDLEFSRLSPSEFAKKVLFERLKPECVVVGFNYGFGKARSGGVEVLEEAGRSLGFDVVVVPPVKVGKTRVSSTGIRKAVGSGDLEFASRLLGRPFFISGEVVRGAGRGSTLGFPTANLKVVRRLLPPEGVYACVATLGGSGGSRWPAAVHLGPAPSFDVPFTIEAHLAGFQGGELYGFELWLEFHERIRGVRRFSGPKELKQRLKEDVRVTVEAMKDLV